MRILLVDDESSLLTALAANLELEGFDVVTATSGKRALEIVARGGVDLVLTDIRMPEMSGVELFHEIRLLQPRVPVVLMTAFAREGLVDQALAAGAFAVLAKPFAIDHVLATLARAARLPVVLIVDGDEAAATAAALTASGIRAEAATDADSALRAVRDGRVDVCVVPLIPEREEAAALVRRLLTWEPAPTFIAVVGRSVSDVAQRMAALPAFGFVREPVEVPALARLIAHARGAASPARALSAPNR